MIGLPERGCRWPTDGENVRPSMPFHVNLRATSDRLRSVNVIVFDAPGATSPKWSSSFSSPSASGRSSMATSCA